MTLQDILLHLRVDGWCVIPNVIPASRVDATRSSVEATAEKLARAGKSDGVRSVKGLVSHDQSIAPYLADKHVLDVAEALFGPLYRPGT